MENHSLFRRKTILNSMKKMSLKESLLETEDTLAQEPFVIHGAVKKLKGGEYSIYREFPLVVTPEMIPLMQLSPKDISEINAKGFLDDEHEITIDVYLDYRPYERRTQDYPGVTEGFDFEGYAVTGIDGIGLDAVDCKRLEEYIGDLTQEEIERIEEYAMEKQNDGPDLDEGWDTRFENFSARFLTEAVNPYDPEYESIAAFAEYMMDDDREEFTHEDLRALNMRTHARVDDIRKELEAIGFKLAYRAPEKRVRGFQTSSNDRWYGPGSQKTHGGAGIDPQTGRATSRGTV